MGADTQRRFRHQACYAAILSLGLLADDGHLDELYCGHHDDIVLHLKSGKFRAVQVKTRLVGGVPFKASDDEVLKSLRKFATLESTFPGHFEVYVLASNVGFWHKKKNGNNLQHLLDTLEDGSVDSCMKFAKKIVGTQQAFDSAIAIVMLRKVRLWPTPGLDDIESRLVDNLADIPEYKGRRYDELKAAAELLLDRMLKAGAIADLGAFPQYIALCSDSLQSVMNEHVIQSKRITKALVAEVVSHGLSSVTLLKTYQVVPITELPTGMKKMELKMAAGGLSVSEIDHLKDLKFSAEYLFQQWLYRYGPELSQQYYEHVRVVVRDECLAAQYTSQQVQGLYGNQMLSDLRQRLLQRTGTRSAEVPDYLHEHLLGIAGILTEDCKVWWSVEFKFPEGLS